MRNLFSVLLVSSFLIGVAPTRVFAGEDEPPANKKNCKITVRRKMKNGKTKLEIMEVATATREECKLQAEDQRKALDEDVASVKTSFGFTQ